MAEHCTCRFCSTANLLMRNEGNMTALSKQGTSLHYRGAWPYILVYMPNHGEKKSPSAKIVYMPKRIYEAVYPETLERGGGAGFWPCGTLGSCWIVAQVMPLAKGVGFRSGEWNLGPYSTFGGYPTSKCYQRVQQFIVWGKDLSSNS